MDKISVIIPVHNGEKWIRKTVKGILAQTYKNIEIILVENSSIDQSWKICQEIARTASRVKAIQSLKKGTSLARRGGVKAATGKYIIFSDQDDTYVDKKSIEHMHQAIKEDGTQIVQFGYWKNYIGGIKRKVLLTKNNIIFERNELFDDEIKGVFGMPNSVFTPTVWTKIYDAQSLKRAMEGITESLVFAEDCYMNCRAFFEESIKTVSVRAEAYYVWNVGTGFSASHHSGEVLFDELRFVKPLQISLLEENRCNENIIYLCHLEILYFMKAMITQLIEENPSYEMVIRKIEDLSEYEIVKNAKKYFRTQTLKENWEELNIMASDLPSADYYEWIRRQMPKKNLKSVIRRILIKCKR